MFRQNRDRGFESLSLRHYMTKEDAMFEIVGMRTPPAEAGLVRRPKGLNGVKVQDLREAEVPEGPSTSYDSAKGQGADLNQANK